MVFNRLFARRITAVFFLFFILPFVYAQEANYYLDTSGAHPRFFQRLSWTGDNNAIFYEVIIEKEGSGGIYTEVLRERTEKRTINVSLAAGFYRYSVIPYNMLERPDEGSGWRRFEVIAAYIPSINRFNPPAFYLDRYYAKELEIIGDNLLEESDIYLLKTTGSRIYPIKKEILSRERVKLTFDDSSLVTGQYQIHVKNPGGLETSAVTLLSIGYRKPLDLFLKISWIPVIPAYGDIYNLYGAKFNMTGIGLSFEAISSARSDINGGLELSASFFAINPDFKNDSGGFFKGLTNPENGASCTEFDFNFLFQKQFMLKRMSVTARIGIGGTTINSSDLENSNGILFHFNFGLSYLYFLRDVFFMEAGATFSHYLGLMSTGLIKPRLTAGWLF